MQRAVRIYRERAVTRFQGSVTTPRPTTIPKEDGTIHAQKRAGRAAAWRRDPAHIPSPGHIEKGIRRAVRSLGGAGLPASSVHLIVDKAIRVPCLRIP